MTTTQEFSENVTTDVNTALLQDLTRDLAQRIVERDNAIVAADEAEKELSDYKRRVLRVAMAAQRRHNWCSTFDEALEELDLARPRQKYSGQVNFQVQFTTTDTNRMAGRDLPGPRVVQSDLCGLEAIVSAIRGSLTAESNHRDFTIGHVTFDVGSLVAIVDEDE